MTKKEQHRLKLVEYLSDPENEWIARTALSLEVLDYSDRNTIYKIFTPAELTEIEEEALAERKRRSAGQRAHVYAALFKQAKEGNVQAAKEFLDRVEGKVPDKLLAKHDIIDHVEIKLIDPDGNA